jgi:hypothetical protein
MPTPPLIYALAAAAIFDAPRRAIIFLYAHFATPTFSPAADAFRRRHAGRRPPRDYFAICCDAFAAADLPRRCCRRLRCALPLIIALMPPMLMFRQLRLIARHADCRCRCCRCQRRHAAAAASTLK